MSNSLSQWVQVFFQNIPENSRPDFNISEINQQDRKVRDFGHENKEEQR